jgi:M6 family metalloprotease-like protein
VWLVGSVSGQAPSRASGPIHIIAVMVDFQPDANRLTSGDGTFNLDFLARHSITIDPLPHDRGYFQAHLEFSKRYFEKVSSGVLSVSYEVLPTVYRLDHPMERYSPIGESDSANYRLTWLAQETWQKVAQSGALDHYTGDADRTMFVIFHAGVGRDLEVTGTTLVKTPQDIPSVYLTMAPNERIVVNSNGLTITETAILPQTESRPGTDITGGEFVLELSINGITTAMVGNFLGLPDLYNTLTGESGIGRFGLMDGAGFFSYYGLFPPEPSAWEKVHMGWVTPQALPLDDSAPISLPLGTVYKHRISADEHILIENRHRDPLNAGLTLTIRTPTGATQTVLIPRTEERFNPFDLGRLNEIVPAGTLIDVSHYDWSLPGGIDIHRYLAGGILIWRIQDAVIRETLASNRINANPARRGVSLIEADAAQDIGRPAGLMASYDQGAPFDFWWSGNDFTVITLTGQRIVLYQNRWADDTTPSNRSVAGTPTFFELYGFSDNQPNASFRAKRSAPAELEPRPTVQLPYSSSSDQSAAFLTSYPLFIDTVGDHVLFPLSDRLIAAHTPSGTIGSEPLTFPHQPLRVGSNVFLTTHRVANAPGFPARLSALSNGAFSTIWTQTSVSGSSSYPLLNVAGDHILIGGEPTGLNVIDGSRSVIPHPNDAPSAVRRFTLQELPAVPWTIRGDEIRRDERLVHQGLFHWPHFGDRNGDGRPETYFVNPDDRRLYARNESGALLDDFPIDAPVGFGFIGTPILVGSTLITYASDGISLIVTGHDSEGRLVAPFPLLVGRAPAGDRAPLGLLFADRTLHALSAAGEWVSWRFPSANASLTVRSVQDTFSIAGSATENETLLVSRETYNWPNPAQNETHIRFQSMAGAAVSIQVISFDGLPKLTRTIASASGVPEEIRIDTSSWSSGVYFCRVEASLEGKKSGKLIKLVVVK